MEYVLDDRATVRSPKVIFTIGAKRPADPDVSAVELYGAKAEWQFQGDTEQFTIAS